MEEKAEEIEEVIFQICRVCKERKCLSEFYKKKGNKLGRSKICKKCKAIEDKKRYERNRKHLAEQIKQYHHDHKEQASKCGKKYYQCHKEQKSEYGEKYRRNHKKQRADQQKRYRQTERGCLLRRFASQRRRAREAEVSMDASGPTPGEFKRIIKNQKHRCNLCGKKFCKSRPPTMDHIQPLSKGGAHDSSNIQALCGSCNSCKGKRILKGFINSWLNIQS